MKNTVEKFYKGVRTQMKKHGRVREEDVKILMQMVHWIANTAQFCPECSQEGCQTCDANFRENPQKFVETAYAKCRADTLAKKDVPIKFNHSAHVKMWTWLAENPGKRKEDATKACSLPRATEKDVPSGYVWEYACVYAREAAEAEKRDWTCDDCPFPRGDFEDEFADELGELDEEYCFGGLLSAWEDFSRNANRDPESAAWAVKLAKFFVSLPVRSDVDTE